MGLSSTLKSLLFFLGTCGTCSGFAHENCSIYGTQFERVYSVPGDVAMLNSTLVAPDVFDFRTEPYNITWYNPKTDQEMEDQAGRILVKDMTLWFLRVTLEDSGEYVTLLRTPSRCFTLTTELVVELPAAGACERPQKANQMLTKGAADHVSCPLSDQISKLRSYNISSSIKWYRGCELIEDETRGYTYWDLTKLSIDEVDSEHNGLYTCTLTFTLGGVTGSMSETVDAWVKEVYTFSPQVHEPGNEIIKAPIGSNFTKRCLVFVPCVGEPFIDVFWIVNHKMIGSTDPADRVYSSEKRVWRQDEPPKGLWYERLLMFSELQETDFNLNYTCQAFSSRGIPKGYFTLLPQDPDITLPIGLVLGHMGILFISSVVLYYIFKIDIVLWTRRTFPILYPNKDLDGKLYDAYVAYPQPGAMGYSEEVEEFALHTLPKVLEKACGYKLFIADRDCLPGEATVDSLEENLQASRQILILYTASTFVGKEHLSNNNSENSQITENSMNNNNEKEVYPDMRQQLECMIGMHRALLEGSLKVVLVELEEVSPAQLALFPESVLHLRKKQGAVCWWKSVKKTKRSVTCRRRKDEEKGGQDTKLSPSLSPTSRFWKEMRYHMPARGKRAVFPEGTPLLNL